ncbi:unnamed protein product, partial [marine sediment metagenome]
PEGVILPKVPFAKYPGLIAVIIENICDSGIRIIFFITNTLL